MDYDAPYNTTSEHYVDEDHQEDKEENQHVLMLDTITKPFREQCESIMANYTPTEELRCPPTFDSWSCWNATLAGETAYAPCPFFITGFDPRRTAHKVCTEDGTWFRHPESNLTWSNYTTCVDYEDLEMRQAIVNVYIAGYSISLIALVASLAILCVFRQSLKCTRIYIHRNLFASFIVNNGGWVLWYKCVANQPEVLLENGIGCKTLHVLLHYFLVSNYFWMFCEGLYLHTVLVVAFLAENSIMRWFHFLGWGLPAIFIAIYTAVRHFGEETKHCWMEESQSSWILSGPVCLSMLFNTFFLINIVRVLVTKLKAPVQSSYTCSQQAPPSESQRSRPENEECHRLAPINRGTLSGSNHLPGENNESYTPINGRNGVGSYPQHGSGRNNAPNSLNGLRKAVRATLILLPLLGLHYVVMPFRPEAGAPGELAYQIVSAVFTSFQGLCVAFLFCFCNGEVLQVLRKEIVRHATSRKIGLRNRRMSTRSVPMTTEL